MTTLTLTETCPRCGGGYHRERHFEGTEWTCIRCGHVKYEDAFEPMDIPEPEFTRSRHVHRPPSDFAVSVMGIVRGFGEVGALTREVRDLAPDGSKTRVEGALNSLYARHLIDRIEPRIQHGHRARWVATQEAQL